MLTDLHNPEKTNKNNSFPNLTELKDEFFTISKTYLQRIAEIGKLLTPEGKKQFKKLCASDPRCAEMDSLADEANVIGDAD